MAALVAGPRGSRVLVGTRADGDFRPDSSGVESRRTRASTRPWTMLDEEHGTTVRVVSEPGEWDGRSGDALVTVRDDVVLGLWVGDCAPLALIGSHSVAAVHCGWRGLRDGVIDSTLDAIAHEGDEPTTAVIGPRIGPCCNQFGEDDLATVQAVFGDDVRSSDSAGRPSLDLARCIGVALARRTGVRVVDCRWCTRCRPDLFFSNRGGDPERQVFAVWR